MGGAYGDILLAFPELRQGFAYFDMAPAVDSGWGPPTQVQTIDGVMQNRSSNVKDSNGNLVRTVQRELWTEATLVSGRFVRDEDGTIYRISGDSEWRREAGFTAYPLRRLVGADGTDTEDVDMSLGTGSFQ